MPASFCAPDLQHLELFAGLPARQLDWIASHGDRIQLAQGDRLVSRGDPADYMFVIVDGLLQRYEEIGGQWLVVARTRPGQVTGMLPFSRMTHYPGHMIAAEPTTILRLRGADFTEMLAMSNELGQRLVARMSDRVRGDVRLEQQREKMTALGRLSAGLAHELNNPAAAAARAAGALASELQALQAVAMSLVRHRPDDEVITRANALSSRARDGAPPTLSPIERSQREEDLTDWLEEHDVPQAWDVASAFVEAGVTVGDLTEFAATGPPTAVADAVAWIGCHLSADRMVRQIGAATGRISELVAAVKTYSHMDRSAEHKLTDVREGLDSTVVMLGDRLKDGAITLEREYQENLPLFPANAGELNQVWTHLIDNALDALHRSGTLRIVARTDGPWVCVDIVDNGPGIPDEIRGRIFEPFFTTKDVGEGTGLGLDIAQRIVNTHQGQIDVRSRPGRTEFSVRLPVSPTPFQTPAESG